MTTPRAQYPTTGREQVIGETWADRKGLNTLPVGPVRRDPCPICGHPTSDCTSEGAHRG